MRVDRTVFKARTLADADADNLFSTDTGLEERLRMAFDLVCTIYGIKEGDSLKIDRKIFSASKFK